MSPTTPPVPAGTPRRRTRVLALGLFFLLGLAAGGPAITPASASASSVAAGERHSCALKAPGGEVWCWGNNSYGALGNGTTDPSSVPVRAGSLNGMVAVAAGSAHSCAVAAAGTVWCWGDNDDGKLGDGTDLGRESPVQVGGITDAVGIVAGEASSCALHRSGNVSCWGSNSDGQLGIGDPATDESFVHRTVPGIGGATALAAGEDHVCALLGGGTVRCWGDNAYGKLGVDPATSELFAPAVDVPGVVGATAISAGAGFTCTIHGAGAVACWGSDSSGQLGDGAGQTTRHTPAPVAGLPAGALAIAAGESFACAALSDGGTWCWGDNQYAQLAGGSAATSSAVPVAAGGAAATEFAAGAAHVCTRTTRSAVECWGNGADGQLGQGKTVNASAPSAVAALPPASGVSVGVEASCALHSAGQVSCWGYGRYGTLGAGPGITGRQPSALAVPGISDARRIALGNTHACALRGTSTALPQAISCWGTNDYGQLGVSGGSGQRAFSPVGTALTGELDGDPASGFVALTAGTDFNCVLASKVTLTDAWCWGRGGKGQLGNGATSDQHTLQFVLHAGLSFVADQSQGPTLTSGDAHSCAVSSDGSVWCWGANESGQLGSGAPALASQPQAVPGVSGAVSVAAGASHSCALIGDGSVICWGSNGAGQLGTGSTSPGATAPAAAGITGAKSIAAGAAQTCAITTTDELHCWGVRRDGAFAPSAVSAVPARVATPGNTAVAALSSNHSCALSTGGTVTCWGNGTNALIGNGEMPHGNYPLQRTPTQVIGFDPLPDPPADRLPGNDVIPGPPLGPPFIGDPPPPAPPARPSPLTVELRDGRLHLRGLPVRRAAKTKSCPKSARALITGRAGKRTVRSSRTVRLRRAGAGCSVTANLRIIGRLAQATRVTLQISGKGVRTTSRNVRARTSGQLRGGRLRLDRFAIRSTDANRCPAAASITVTGSTKATRKHRLTNNDLKVALAPTSGCMVTANLRLPAQLRKVKKVSITLRGTGLRTTKKTITTR